MRGNISAKLNVCLVNVSTKGTYWESTYQELFRMLMFVKCYTVRQLCNIRFSICYNYLVVSMALKVSRKFDKFLFFIKVSTTDFANVSTLFCRRH